MSENASRRTVVPYIRIAAFLLLCFGVAQYSRLQTTIFESFSALNLDQDKILTEILGKEVLESLTSSLGNGKSIAQPERQIEEEEESPSGEETSAAKQTKETVPKHPAPETTDSQTDNVIEESKPQEEKTPNQAKEIKGPEEKDVDNRASDAKDASNEAEKAAADSIDDPSDSKEGKNANEGPGKYQYTYPSENVIHHRNRIHIETDKSYSDYKTTKVGGKVVDVTQNRDKIQEFLASPDQKEAKLKVPPPPEKPLNVVLFYADDWTQKVMGTFNKHVKTPNIDALAKDGMSFTHNCVTTSICWISRATLATGTYAAIHKHLMPGHEAMFNNSHFAWKDTMYPLIKKNGIETALIGKWHAPMPMEDITFDHYEAYFGEHWMNHKGKLRHVTDVNGEDAMNFLRNRKKDKKFHLTLSFFATHAWDGNERPYHPMNSSMSLYANDEIPEVRTNTDAHYEALPPFFRNTLNEGRFRYTKRFDTPENYQRNVKDLFRMATEVDTVVGDVVAELKSQGLYNDTLIIFTTDNGNMHGEHGLAEKWYAFEESIRVPLVIRDPRMPASQRGTVSNEFTLSVDLAPTILSAAKIEVPTFMQGRDMSEIYLQPKQAKDTWRKDFFYEWNTGDHVNASGHEFWHIPAVFALIRKDFKYFYYPEHNYEQLFQIEKDPYEEKDQIRSNATSTKEALDLMRARYAFLKKYSQNGLPV